MASPVPRLLTAALLLVGGLPLAGTAQAGVAANMAFTSDYVWRGSSQTGGDPAVQAGVRASLPRGLYLGAWGSNVAFVPDAGARSEFDLAIGWQGEPGAGWVVDASATRYVYPGTGRALDWTEVAATATWRDALWLQVAHSSDALAGGHDGTWMQMGARVPVHARIRLEVGAAQYRLSRAHGPDYLHGQVGAAVRLVPDWELRITGHITDGAARKLFPGAAGSRLEVALQGSF